MALVVGLSLAATLCSSGAGDKAEPTTRPTSKSSTTTTPKAEDEVVRAYRRFWDTYLAAADPPNPEDPRLSDVATGDERRKLGGTFLAAKEAGEVFRGSIDLAPVVLEVASDRARLRDCYDDHILAYDAKTGELKDRDDPRRHLVVVTMVLQDARWKVTSIVPQGDGCVPDA
ncbi:MAG: hypothetical protein ACRD0D_09785 [Acidimicrobiales bacterium]